MTLSQRIALQRRIVENREDRRDARRLDRIRQREMLQRIAHQNRDTAW